MSGSCDPSVDPLSFEKKLIFLRPSLMEEINPFIVNGLLEDFLFWCTCSCRQRSREACRPRIDTCFEKLIDCSLRILPNCLMRFNFCLLDSAAGNASWSLPATWIRKTQDFQRLKVCAVTRWWIGALVHENKGRDTLRMNRIHSRGLGYLWVYDNHRQIFAFEMLDGYWYALNV